MARVFLFDYSMSLKCRICKTEIDRFNCKAFGTMFYCPDHFHLCPNSKTYNDHLNPYGKNHEIKTKQKNKKINLKYGGGK